MSSRRRRGDRDDPRGQYTEQCDGLAESARAPAWATCGTLTATRWRGRTPTRCRSGPRPVPP